MHPELLSLRLYPLFMGLAVAAGTAVALFAARREGISARRYLRAQAFLVAAALLGAKAQSLLERGGAVDLAWELAHGYRYAGGVVAVIIILPLVRSLVGASFAKLGDVIAPAIGAAFGTLRLGCFLAGCCYGKVCALPWAVRFPAGSMPFNAHVDGGLLVETAMHSLPVHPLQLYFGAAALGAAAFVLWLQPRKAYDGQLLLLYLAVHEPIKAMLETVRHQTQPHVQLASLALGVAAVSGLLIGAALVRWRAAGAKLAPVTGSSPAFGNRKGEGL